MQKNGTSFTVPTFDHNFQYHKSNTQLKFVLTTPTYLPISPAHFPLLCRKFKPANLKINKKVDPSFILTKKRKFYLASTWSLVSFCFFLIFFLYTSGHIMYMGADTDTFSAFSLSFFLPSFFFSFIAWNNNR